MAELIAYELETDLFVANGQLRFCGWEAEIALNLDPALSAAMPAFAYLHGRGFVHRVVKPQNLLSTKAGLIKLADFGLARAIAPEEPRASVCIAGTPAYMAPEQVDPTLGPVSPATDVWAVGVMLNEMLGG